jgi:HK97 family phage major capsid protein
MSQLLTNIKELKEERKQLHESQSELLTKASKENRDLTAEEEAKYQDMEKRFEDLDSKLTKAEETRKRHELLAERGERLKDSGHQLDDRNRPIETDSRGRRVRPDSDEAITQEHRALALQAWCRSQEGMDLTPEHQEACERTGVKPNQRQFPIIMPKRAARSLREIERRAQGVATDGAGNYTVAEDFIRELEIAQLLYASLRGVARIRRTETGADLPMPTTNDTGNSGALLGENTGATEQDVTFGQVLFNAYKITSKLVKVSQELLEDSALDFAADLGNLLGTRIGRIEGSLTTTGTGSSQPRGVVTASTLGKTAASATAITLDELLDLKHSVDPAYRVSAHWMFQDGTLKAIKKLVDSEGRRLWQAAVAGGEPDTLDGDPYVINQAMAAMTTGQKTVLYGNFNKYMIREVREMRMYRLEERFRDADQVGFVIFKRMDGDLLDAGVAPVKHLIQA